MIINLDKPKLVHFKQDDLPDKGQELVMDERGLKLIPGPAKVGKSYGLRRGLDHADIDYCVFGENVDSGRDIITGCPPHLYNLRMLLTKCDNQIIIIDSLSVVYGIQHREAPAMKGGFDPSIAALIFELHWIAVQNNLMIIAVYNTIDENILKSANALFEAKIRGVLEMRNFTVRTTDIHDRLKRVRFKNDYLLDYLLPKLFTRTVRFDNML